MAGPRKKLIAIDGNSLFYRAFFGMRYLSTSSGQPTNALYGLTVMLLKVLEEKPDYIAVAFDTPQPTFRHVEYKEYKAQRKPAPEALIEQAPLARDVFRAFGVPVVELPGFEADDIVGAMAREAEKRDVDAVILTGDLDTLQLVNDHISVMTTVKGVSDTIIYDRAAVIERFGIPPEQMPDYKGLKGDSSDNIPGVPGIGDKTAVDLLTRYGSVEDLLEHANELPEGRVRSALVENADLARLSKRLGTIVTDLPIDIDIDHYKAREPDYNELRDLFVKLEFKTLIKRLPEVAKAEGKAPETRAALGECRRIGSTSELADLIRSLQATESFALQCHTADRKSIRAELVGVGFCFGSDETAYVKVIDPVTEGEGGFELRFEGDFQASLSQLAPVLTGEKPAKYCHDYKLNYSALALRGVRLKGVVFDTMLAAYLLDPSRSSFEIGDVAFEQLTLEMPGVTRKQDGDAEVDDSSRVCGEAEAVYRLKPVLEGRLSKDGLAELLADVELPIAPILAEMELTGVVVDVDQLAALSERLDVDVRNLEASIHEQAGEKFNIGSTKQLQTILFDKLGLAAGRKTKTGFSTSAAALDELAADNPIVSDILRWRELSKIKSTYADALPKLINPVTGRIHTSLNQAIAATGRLSSSDPNLQNIPVRTELGREIRRAFIASGDNVLLSADYSQIELRILAHVTGDPNLVRAFENDEDIHTATACIVFNCAPSDVTPEMRRRAKTINFSVIYGVADFTLSRSLGISIKEARDYIDTYFARFPGVRTYTDETIEKARNLGYVTTLLGRRRYVPDVNNANHNIRMNAERAAVNMPIQGSAADIMKLAMIRVDRELSKTPSKMLLQVHDELLFEVPPAELSHTAEIVRREMENAYPMRVRLKVDVKAGENWSEMSEVR